MTARDLINRALRAIGVLAQGETATAAEMQDALLVLQDMADAWRAQRATILQTERAVFDLQVGVQDYTLGTWVATATSPQPTVSVQGAPGATSYSYRIAAVLTTGEELPAGAVGSTTTGNATLTGVNFNRLTWTALSGAASYRVYRTVGAATQGLIATVTAATVDDTGLAGDGASAPTTVVPPLTHFEHVVPVSVSHASILDTTNASQPLETALSLISVEQWQQTAIKAVASDPTEIYFAPASPYWGVHLWPIPDSAALDLVLYVPLSGAWFADLTTDYLLPPGYADAFRYQLAVRLAPEYGRQLDAQIAQLAADALATVKRANLPREEMSIDPRLLGQARAWDYLTGE